MSLSISSSLFWGIIAPAITAALVLMMTPAMTGAFAVGPDSVTRTGGLHFTNVPNNPDLQPDDGTLTATGEVAGAGPQARATLTATAEATLGCLTNEPRGNPGGGQNEPRGLRDVDTQTTGSVTFETRQGRGSFEVTTDEVTISDFENFRCPSRNMSPVLVGDITFTNIVLTIESQTGTLTATFPDQ